MVRMLVWLVVAGALLGLFYKVATRGGMEREAARTREAALASPRAVSMPAIKDVAATPAPQATGAIAFGLSFALATPPAAEAKVAYLSCHGEPVPTDQPHRGSCNPYERGAGIKRGTRYWVRINDQAGNCWDSAP